MKTLNTIVAAAANVNVTEYEHLLNRGMRATKALFRLGVEQQLAGILGCLQLASTAEEINAVYANEEVRSCMTGQSVGEFYSSTGFSVIYSDRYRILVHLEHDWISARGYGFLCNSLDPILRQEHIFSNLDELRLDIVNYTEPCLELEEISFNSYGSEISETNFRVKTRELTKEFHNAPYFDSITPFSSKPFFLELDRNDSEILKNTDFMKAKAVAYGMPALENKYDSFYEQKHVLESQSFEVGYEAMLLDYYTRASSTFVGFYLNKDRMIYKDSNGLYFVTDCKGNVIEKNIEGDLIVSSKDPNGRIFLDIVEDFPF